MSSSIYDLLTGEQISDVSTTNLHTATSRSYVSPAPGPFWSPLILLSHVVKAARTYAHGIIIPESGAVWTQEIADSATASVQPTGTEVWRVEGIDIDSCSVAFYDGSTICGIDTTQNTPPYYISRTNYLIFKNGSGSAKTPDVAYSKVSL